MRYAMPLVLFTMIVGTSQAGEVVPDEAGVTMLFQSPVLDPEDLETFGLAGSLSPADASCNVSALCPWSQVSVTINAPWDVDVAQVVAINEIDLWGSYIGAPPPETDSFTFRLHQDQSQPAGVICHQANLQGTREIVGSAFGHDVYRHTLRLPSTCFASFIMSGYWVEIYNDTGAAGDWHWLLGNADWSNWDPVWGSLRSSQIPGANWQPGVNSYAVRLRTGAPGGVSSLRLNKDPSGDSLILHWGEDCGVHDGYSVYRGSLLEGYGSMRMEPLSCEIAGTTADLPVGEGDADFFIVAPFLDIPSNVAWISGLIQGSYGFDSAGQARAEPGWYLDRCTQQLGFDACAP